MVRPALSAPSGMFGRIIEKLKRCFRRTSTPLKKKDRKVDEPKPKIEPPKPKPQQRDLIFFQPEPVQYDPNEIDPTSLAELLRLQYVPTNCVHRPLRLLERRKTHQLPKKLTITSGSEASDETSSEPKKQPRRQMKSWLANRLGKQILAPSTHSYSFHYLEFLDSDTSDSYEEVIEEVYLAEEE